LTSDSGDRECLDNPDVDFDIPDPSVVVVERGGRYYVDPLASMVDYMTQLLDQVTDADIDCFVADMEVGRASYDDSDYDRLSSRAERICANAPLGETILDN
jgi:hypothetical protein